MRSATRSALAGLVAVGLVLLAGVEGAFGAYISNVAATASSSWGGGGPVYSRDIRHAVDGTDKYTTVPDDSDLDPPADDKGMWMTRGPGDGDSIATAWAKFDLGAEYRVTRMDVYNYNEPCCLNRGIATMDVSYSTDDVTYTPLVTGGFVAAAPGNTNAWGPSASIDFGDFNVRYVVISNFTSHGNPDVVGLNEVEFYEFEEAEPEYIPLVHATASSVLGQRYVEHLVDGTDKHTTHPDDADMDPPADDGGMWLTTSLAGEWARFDLHGVYEVSRMDVWNYNESGYANRGVGTMDVSYSTDGVTYTALVTNKAVAIAPGNTNAYGPSATVDFGGVNVRYVKLDNFTTHGGTIVGLNEVEFHGLPVLLPPYISVVRGTASSVLQQRYVEHLVDGTDKYTTNPDDGDLDPPADDRGMWLTTGLAGEWARFDFRGLHKLSHMDVWNYNESGYTHRGVGTMDVSHSTDGVTYTTLVAGQPVFRAPGIPGPWGRSASINLGGVQARYVKLDNFTTHGDSLVGLNEVEFYGSGIEVLESVTNVQATASSSWGGGGPVFTRDIRHTVDGTDKHTTLPDDPDLDPPADSKGMWMTLGPGEGDSVATAWAEFDLLAEYALSHMDIYNYNEANHTHRGIATMDVWHSADDVTYTPLVSARVVNRAPGTGLPWGPSARVWFAGQKVRYVRIDNFTVFWGDVAGLNEVEFYWVPQPLPTLIILL